MYRQWPSGEERLSYATEILFWSEESYFFSDENSLIETPIRLPAIALFEGYSEKGVDSVLRNDSKNGPSKYRNRYNATYEEVVESYLLTRPQLKLLKNFYKLLGEGVEPFIKLCPITRKKAVYRFSGSLEWSYDGNMVNTTLPLEKIAREWEYE